MKKIRTAKVQAITLTCDYNIYPRPDIDRQLVTKYVRRLQLGERPPPIIVDEKSGRIVDGFHRRDSAIRFGGDGAMIEAEFWKYDSEAEIVLDAARRNDHGKPLTTHDCVRVGVIARTHGANDDQISDALHLPLERFRLLMETRVALPRSPRDGKNKKGKPTKAKIGSEEYDVAMLPEIILKRPTIHMANRTMTAEQEEVNKHLCGLSQRQYVDHLIGMINANMIEREDDALVDQMVVLWEALEKFLKKVGRLEAVG